MNSIDKQRLENAFWLLESRENRYILQRQRSILSNSVPIVFSYSGRVSAGI